MTTTQDPNVLRVEVAQTPRQPREPATDDRLPIPARPAAITAANSAALIATGAAAIGGPVGIAAGAVAAGAVAYGTHRAVRRRTRTRAERSETTTTTRAPGTGQAARRAGGGQPAGGRGRAGTGQPGPAGGRAGRRAGSGQPGGQDAGHGRAGKRGPLDKLAKALSGTRAGKAAKAAAGKVGKAAKAAAGTVGKAARAAAGKTGEAAARAARNARAGAKQAARRAVGKGGAGAAQPCHRTAQHRPVRGDVDRGGQQAPAAARAPQQPRKDPHPEIRPSNPGTNGRTRPMSNGNAPSGMRNGVSVLWQMARKFADAAATYRTRGHGETRTEAYELHLTLSQIAQGITYRAQQYQRDQVTDATTAALYLKIAESVQACATAARRIGPGFDAANKQHLDNLRHNPAPEKWDAANNRGV